MAQLFINVIAIALASVAAITGGYYGGSAFLDGQTTSYANTIINQGNQLKAGYILYLADGNSPLPSGTAINGTDAFSNTPKYISTQPKIPAHLQANNTWTIQNNICATRIVIEITSEKVCNKISQIISNQSMSSPANVTTRLFTYGADCYYYDVNGNGVYNTGDYLNYHICVQK